MARDTRRYLLRNALGLGACALGSPIVGAAERIPTTSKPARGGPASTASSAHQDIRIVNLDLLEEEARSRLTPFAYAFVSGGAGDEWTLRENRRALQNIPILTRRLAGVETREIDLAVQLLDLNLPHPIIVAPMGAHGVVHRNAEAETAAGAGAAQALYQCSSASNRPLEAVAAATQGPKWFQIYLNNDDAVNRSLLTRAKAAGFTAIVLTVDAVGPGGSDRVRRLGQPFPADLTFANHDPRYGGIGNFRDQRQGVTARDIAFCREVSGLPVVVKGILRADDASEAIRAGASAVQVSNHGGRQFDGVPTSISALPRIADAVQGRVPIILDGGIRRGGDVFRALALGASAVAVGRPILYGLGLGGAPGVRAVIEFLQSELRTAMLFSGNRRIGDIKRTDVV